VYTLRYVTGASTINRDWIAGRAALRLSRSTATQEQRCWHRTCFTAASHQLLLTSAQHRGTDDGVVYCVCNGSPGVKGDMSIRMPAACWRGLPRIEACADDGRRGLLVVGELQNSQQAAAAARIGAALGWPVVADVLSGERLWCCALPAMRQLHMSEPICTLH
jgi:hypothetical protein